MDLWIFIMHCGHAGFPDFIQEFFNYMKGKLIPCKINFLI